jgi:microcin C transport system substrate-binding protein
MISPFKHPLAAAAGRAWPSFFLTALLACLPLLTACGGGETEADVDLPPGSHDNSKEVEEYYQTKVALPPDVFDAFERGDIKQDEIDQRAAAGEFEKFFHQATPADLPEGLVWENGMDLPDLGSPEAKKGGTVFMSLQDYPRTLRLVGPDSNGSFRAYILDDTAMRLAQRHPNVTEIGPTGNRLMPGIAKEWAIDRPSKTVYARIDPEARWSDGEPITTEDIFFTFFFNQSTYINAPWSNNFYNRTFAGVTRYDDLTFAVKLHEAKPNMNEKVLDLVPVPRHFYHDLGPDYVERYQWKFAPTTGPYVVLTEHLDKGRSITLTRNDDWWAKDKKFYRNRYNFDRIHFAIIRDKPKAFEAFKKGELDTMRIREAEYWYDKLPDSDPLVKNGYIGKYTAFNDTVRGSWGLWINEAQPLLDDRDVRTGINYASNWDLVIEKYFRGDFARMRTSYDGFGEFTHPTLKAREFSVEKALDSFAKAGFKKRGADGILVNDRGQRLSFTLSTGYENFRDILTILREEAQKAGLEFRLEILDHTAAFKKSQEKQHDIVFTGFNVSPEMYPRYWEYFHSTNAYDRPFLEDGSVNKDRKIKVQTNNLFSLANRELDELIDRYVASEDAEEMKTLAHRIEEIVKDEACFVPGFVMPFYRFEAWRYVRFPDQFAVKLATEYEEYWVHWIDEDLKKEVLQAKKAGRALTEMVLVDETYRVR